MNEATQTPSAAPTRYLGVLSKCDPTGYGSAVVLNGNPNQPPEHVFVHFREVVDAMNTLKLGDTLSFEIIADEAARPNPHRRAAKVHIIRRAVAHGGYTNCPCCDRILPDSAANGYGINRKKRQERMVEQLPAGAPRKEEALRERFGANYVPPDKRYTDWPTESANSSSVLVAGE